MSKSYVLSYRLAHTFANIRAKDSHIYSNEASNRDSYVFSNGAAEYTTSHTTDTTTLECSFHPTIGRTDETKWNSDNSAVQTTIQCPNGATLSWS